MLKLNYSDLGLSVEQFEGDLDQWIEHRVRLAMRAGMTLYTEAGRASFLIAIDHPLFDTLLAATAKITTISVDIADAEYAEVVLQGTWLAESIEACEGSLVCALGAQIEKVIDRLWVLDRSIHTGLRR